MKYSHSNIHTNQRKILKFEQKNSIINIKAHHAGSENGRFPRRLNFWLSSFRLSVFFITKDSPLQPSKKLCFLRAFGAGFIIKFVAFWSKESVNHKQKSFYVANCKLLCIHVLGIFFLYFLGGQFKNIMPYNGKVMGMIEWNYIATKKLSPVMYVHQHFVKLFPSVEKYKANTPSACAQYCLLLDYHHQDFLFESQRYVPLVFCLQTYHK